MFNILITDRVRSTRRGVGRRTVAETNGRRLKRLRLCLSIRRGHERRSQRKRGLIQTWAFSRYSCELRAGFTGGPFPPVHATARRDDRPPFGLRLPPSVRIEFAERRWRWPGHRGQPVWLGAIPLHGPAAVRCRRTRGLRGTTI